MLGALITSCTEIESAGSSSQATANDRGFGDHLFFGDALPAEIVAALSEERGEPTNDSKWVHLQYIDGEAEIENPHLDYVSQNGLTFPYEAMRYTCWESQLVSTCLVFAAGFSQPASLVGWRQDVLTTELPIEGQGVHAGILLDDLIQAFPTHLVESANEPPVVHGPFFRGAIQATGEGDVVTCLIAGIYPRAVDGFDCSVSVSPASFGEGTPDLALVTDGIRSPVGRTLAEIQAAAIARDYEELVGIAERVPSFHADGSGHPGGARAAWDPDRTDGQDLFAGLLTAFDTPPPGAGGLDFVEEVCWDTRTDIVNGSTGFWICIDLDGRWTGGGFMEM